MLLNAHTDIVTAGELKAVHLGDPERYRCSCLAPITQCRYWNRVGEEMRATGHDFRVWDARTHYPLMDSKYVRRLLKPLHRGPWFEHLRDIALFLSPTWRSEYPKFRKRNEALVRSIAAVSGKRVIVESSKISVRLKYALRMENLSVRIVRLVRDGRAVALTYVNPHEFADAKNAELRGGGFGNSKRHVRLSVADASREWLRSNEEAEEILKSVSDADYFSISYEALCESPLGTLNRVFEFLGLSKLRDLPDFRSEEHHVIGNGMRLDRDSTVKLDERWRDVLTETDLRVFDSVAGHLNRRYGYA